VPPIVAFPVIPALPAETRPLELKVSTVVAPSVLVGDPEMLVGVNVPVFTAPVTPRVPPIVAFVVTVSVLVLVPPELTKVVAVTAPMVAEGEPRILLVVIAPVTSMEPLAVIFVVLTPPENVPNPLEVIVPTVVFPSELTGLPVILPGVSAPVTPSVPPILTLFVTERPVPAEVKVPVPLTSNVLTVVAPSVLLGDPRILAGVRPPVFTAPVTPSVPPILALFVINNPTPAAVPWICPELSRPPVLTLPVTVSVLRVPILVI
jgi:hypothetical protein